MTDTKSMACPFCGMRDEACYVNGLNGAKVYQCQWCGAQTICQEDWETRPLEESLRDKNEILQSKLAKEHQVSDALYLLLVDDPNTKLKAEQILIDIYGKCEPSPSDSDVSMTQDVLTSVKTPQSVEIEELEEVVEHLQIRLSEWRDVARQLADELKEEISSKCTVIWEDVGETSPAWIAYNNLVDTEDYEANPDYYNPDYQSPWISITSGRLPEKLQECIVLDKRRHVHNWIHDDALLPLFAQYTHWMPLPEPPEGDRC